VAAITADGCTFWFTAHERHSSEPRCKNRGRSDVKRKENQNESHD
jgi:hypothetical protein